MKISVIIPCYNTAKYLDIAIQSISEQTFSDFEIIVVNDGSTDNSLEILHKIATKEPRLKIINIANSGIVHALNIGVSKSCGEYIARMDADDISLPERFEKQVVFLDNNPQMVAVGTSLSFIDANGKKLEDKKLDKVIASDLFNYPIKTAWLCHPSVMIRKSAFNKIGGYIDAFRFAEDADLWMRLEDVGELAVLPEILFQWRKHNSRTTVNKFKEQVERHIGAILYARLRQEGLPTVSDIKLLSYHDFSYDKITNDLELLDWAQKAENFFIFQRIVTNQILPLKLSDINKFYKEFIINPYKIYNLKTKNFELPGLLLVNHSCRLAKKQKRYIDYFKFLMARWLNIVQLKQQKYYLSWKKGNIKEKQRLKTKSLIKVDGKLMRHECDRGMNRLFERKYNTDFHHLKDTFNPVSVAMLAGRNLPFIFVECSKNGCTTIKRLMSVLDRFEDDYFFRMTNHPHNYTMMGYLTSNNFYMSDYYQYLAHPETYKFCFVRNPYSRVYSAWNDKIFGFHTQKSSGDRNEFSKWVKHIAKISRELTEEPTIKYLIDNPISFEEFIAFIKTQNIEEMDRHWYPQFETLQPDIINYNIIGKIENYKQDVKTIFFDLQINKKYHYLLNMQQNKRKHSKYDWRDAFNKAIAQDVYDIYAKDFEAFGYDKDSWIVE